MEVGFSSSCKEILQIVDFWWSANSIFYKDIIWNKLVSRKVSLFVWQLLDKRIPTKDSLSCRGIIQPGSLLFSSGCSNEESINHLFLYCNFYGIVWYSVMHWLRISSDLPSNFGMLASQIFGPHVFIKDTCTCFRIIWMVTICIIWKERNLWIFQNKKSSIYIVDMVKLNSWWWVRCLCLVWLLISMPDRVIHPFVLVIISDDAVYWLLFSLHDVYFSFYFYSLFWFLRVHTHHVLSYQFFR